MKNFALALLPLAVFVASAVQVDAPGSTTYSAIYPDHLDGPYTGGFSEQTCHSCHFDNDVNSDSGALSLDDLPETFTPGEEYQLTVRLQSDILEKAGFQLTARTSKEVQAGSFSWDTDRISTTPATHDAVDYLQHAEAGTTLTGDDEATWTFTWIAPSSPETVTFNVAANVGNNDDSAFGDWIYVEEWTLDPVN